MDPIAETDPMLLPIVFAVCAVVFCLIVWKVVMTRDAARRAEVDRIRAEVARLSAIVDALDEPKEGPAPPQEKEG